MMLALKMNSLARNRNILAIMERGIFFIIYDWVERHFVLIYIIILKAMFPDHAVFSNCHLT